MLVPSEIVFSYYKFPTLLIVGLIGFLYWLFVIWYEGRKDGFQTDRLPDMAFTSVFFIVITYLIINNLYRWLLVFHPDSPVLDLDYELLTALLCYANSLIPIFVLSRKWKWSKYRLLDIYAMAYSLYLFLFSLGRFLVYVDLNYVILSLTTLALYLKVLRYRGYRYVSGVLFSVFTMYLGLFGIIMFPKGGYLLIYGFLFTMGFVVLLMRRNVLMYKGNLPAEFINILKNKLLNKDKNLKNSQQMLIKEDPYLQEDRATGNAEDMDEAVLEDSRKEISDEEMSIVKRLRLQIKRALAAIKVGKYGICEKCGNPIDKARLQAYPEATSCIECALNESQAEK
jgi:DnaK suppressor protein